MLSDEERWRRWAGKRKVENVRLLSSQQDTWARRSTDDFIQGLQMISVHSQNHTFSFSPTQRLCLWSSLAPSLMVCALHWRPNSQRFHPV